MPVQAKHAPGQVVETKSGKRYIVDQNKRYVPLSSKKNARRNDSSKGKFVSAPRAGSLQLINGQTFVVGEDRKTFIPITPSAASGKGVLTTLLEVAVVILVADLVIDLLIDDLIPGDIVYNSIASGSSGMSGFSASGWNSGGWI